MLAVVMVVGISCDSNGTVNAPCEVCGTYISESDPNSYLTLNSDRTVSMSREIYYESYSGTWNQVGDVIILHFEPAAIIRYALKGDTLEPMPPEWVPWEVHTYRKE
jgi:hypothetical protein